MQPTLKRILSICAVLAFFFALLLVWIAPLDLHVGRSHTSVGHTVSTATVSTPDAFQVRQEGVEIHVIAADDAAIIGTLTEQLTAQLSRHMPTHRINARAVGGEETADVPLILIEITDREVAWTPLWADAAITAEVVYASDGDISWRNAAGMIMEHNTPTVHTRGTIELTDSSQGIFSHFGYQQHLGRALGDEVFKMIESPLFNPPGS